MNYTDYCTCFYNESSKEVIFYDEIKDEVIRTTEAENEAYATKIMQEWKANAPKNVICEII